MTEIVAIHPFIYLPICLYLMFMGLYLQQGLMTLFLARGGLVKPASSQAYFVFASAALCGSLLWVLLSPQMGLSAQHARVVFFISWVIAPLVGYLYVSTLAEHLGIERHRIRWMTACYLLDLASTISAGLVTWMTGKPILFSHSRGSVQSIIDQHLGGAFSPNWFTAVKVILISVLVVASAIFFLKEILKKSSPDRFLLVGVSLTAVAIVLELTSYVLQWSMAFSLLPLANVIEVIRLTHLQTLKAGQTLEKSRQTVTAVRDQMGLHLASLAHDVRTPLSSLKLGVCRLDTDAQHHQIVSELRVELEYLDVVFSNVLALYQLEVSGTSPLARDLDARHPISSCSERFMQLAQDNDVALYVADEDEVLLVHFSPTGLEQALSNLVYSAVIHAKNNVAVSGFIEGGDIVLRVRDDGPILDRSVIPSLADRSFRCELENGRATPDWGLGLAISRAIICSHGGFLVAYVDAEGLLNLEIRLARVSEG